MKFCIFCQPLRARFLLVEFHYFEPRIFRISRFLLGRVPSDGLGLMSDFPQNCQITILENTIKPQRQTLMYNEFNKSAKQAISLDLDRNLTVSHRMSQAMGLKQGRNKFV